jgi:hypothetical protein
MMAGQQDVTNEQPLREDVVALAARCRAASKNTLLFTDYGQGIKAGHEQVAEQIEQLLAAHPQIDGSES